MIKNVGSTDKIIRFVLAAVLGFLYFTGRVHGTLGYVALGVAVIALVTALMSSCPLYSIIGLKTTPKK